MSLAIAQRRADETQSPRAGVDGLFIEAPTSIEERARIAKALDVPQMANMLEGGHTPLVTPKQLDELGFRIAIYGISALLHAIRAMQDVLAKLGRGDISFAGQGVGFERYKAIVGFPGWAEIENRYQPKSGADDSRIRNR